MKRIKIIAAVFSLMVLSLNAPYAYAQSENKEKNDVRKEINVSIENGEHILTITTTENGETTTETYQGKEAEEKMKELHSIHSSDTDSHPDDNHKKVIIKKVVTEEEENDQSFDDHHKHHNVRMFIHETEMDNENVQNWHEHLEGLEGHEDMDMDMDMDIDVKVDKEAGKIIIIKDGEETVVDINNSEQPEDCHMMFISDDENTFDLCKGKKSKSGKGHSEIIVIKKYVVVEEDNDNMKQDLNLENFEVFPNPNDGKFSLKFDLDSKKKTIIRVTDMNGRAVFDDEVKKFNGQYSDNIDLSDQPKGIYLINVIQGKKKTTKKVSIQ